MPPLQLDVSCSVVEKQPFYSLQWEATKQRGKLASKQMEDSPYLKFRRASCSGSLRLSGKNLQMGTRNSLGKHGIANVLAVSRNRNIATGVALELDVRRSWIALFSKIFKYQLPFCWHHAVARVARRSLRFPTLLRQSSTERESWLTSPILRCLT